MTRLPAPLNRTLASFAGWVLLAALLYAALVATP